MLGELEPVMGIFVVALVTGGALVLLVQIHGDLRRLRGRPDSDAAHRDGWRDTLRRLMPLRARIGLVAAAMLTAAALQLAPSSPSATEQRAVDDAELVLISDPAPATSHQGLDNATLVGLVLVVLLIGLGAPFWFEAARNLLRGHPEPEVQAEATPPPATEEAAPRQDLETTGQA